MNAGNNYGFQQLVELCKQTHQEITQTMSAEFRANGNNYPPKLLKEAKNAIDFQIYAYYPRFTVDKIGQQSADQLPRSNINPVEFDGIRMHADLWGSNLEQKERP